MRPDAYRRDLRNYVIGFLLSVILTGFAFGVVAWGGLARFNAIAFVIVLALAQIIVQMRFFLHLDGSREKREDLHLVLFTTAILTIMIGGTLWIMVNLSGRMM